jgi:hypothetical protein
MNKKRAELLGRFTIRASRSDYLLFLAWWEGTSKANVWAKKNRDAVVTVSNPPYFSGEYRVSEWRRVADNHYDMIRRGVIGQKVRMGLGLNCPCDVFKNY